jgi:hypothetical protein
VAAHEEQDGAQREDADEPKNRISDVQHGHRINPCRVSLSVERYGLDFQLLGEPFLTLSARAFSVQASHR